MQKGDNEFSLILERMGDTIANKNYVDNYRKVNESKLITFLPLLN